MKTANDKAREYVAQKRVIEVVDTIITLIPLGNGLIRSMARQSLTKYLELAFMEGAQYGQQEVVQIVRPH